MTQRLFVLTILINMVTYSQPYYYYFRENPNYDTPGYSGDIYRLNLATNSNELFATDVGRVSSGLLQTADQAKLFFHIKHYLAMIDLNDLSHQVKVLPIEDGELLEIKTSLLMNRYYLSFGNEESGGAYEKTIVLDRNTLLVIDTLYENYSDYSSFSFLSYNEQSLYHQEYDSTGIYYSEYNIESKKLSTPQRIGTLGPFISSPYQNDAKKGYALVSYLFTLDTNYLDLEFTLCNVEKKQIVTSIPFPWFSNGYINANYIILEQVKFQYGDENYHTGNIFIFDAQTGKLQQKLTLPPEGKILLFDNYPDKLFYLTGTDGNFQSIQVSLNVITPVTTLIDTLIALTNQSHQQNLIGNSHFAHDLTKTLDEAKKHLTKKHADVKDSIKCAKEVRKFQKKVNEVYEETLEKGKKHEHHKEKFVTVEGWKFLYYNAQYILDRLPALKKEQEEED